MVLPKDPSKIEAYKQRMRDINLGAKRPDITKERMAIARKGIAPKKGAMINSMIYKFTCQTCGVEFERNSKNAHNNKYCSPECFYKNNAGENHFRFNSKLVKCIQCGTELLRSPAYTRSVWGNFCSYDCKAAWQSKHIVLDKHPQWEGGKSFEPYCPLFNKSFKERVRYFFDNKCVLCDALPTREKHHVHHIDANKQTCCDDSPKMFVPLCRSCHSTVRHNAEYYVPYFYNLIQTKYHGRSYFTMEEWETLNPQTLLPIPSHTQSPA
jgi:hypothetical protein